jgi:hypothetical protein
VVSSSQASGELLSVCVWELRRLAAARSTWVIIALAFAIFCAGELLFRAAIQYTITYPNGTTRVLWLDWGSNYGLFNSLPQSPGIFLGLYLPFLAADGVARDLSRRAHELLMTTAISSRFYVWGRYLSTLLLALALACVMLLALITVATVRHLLYPDMYITPDLLGIVALWAFIVLPATILLSGVSFALGTLLPRLSTLIKLAIMLVWFVLANITGRVGASCQDCVLASGATAQRAAWDPTSMALQNLQGPSSLMRRLTTETQGLSQVDFMTHLRTLEQQLPDLSGWLLPHIFWALIGVAAGILAGVYFHRFREAIG